MLPISVLFMLIAINGFYHEVESGVIVDQSEENHGGKFDCSQFTDDFDVLRHFPFPVIEAKSTYDRAQSGVIYNEERTFVKSAVIIEEAIVPWNLFCLTQIEALVIEQTPFENGIIPDALVNLKKLDTLVISNSTITKLPEKMSTMSELVVLQMINCSLTSFPDLSAISNIDLLDVPHNQLTHMIVPPSTAILDLKNNRFTELPPNPAGGRLVALEISNNPWRSLELLNTYKNLTILVIESMNLTSIPWDIDQLTKLEAVGLWNNKLTHLPDEFFKIPVLQYLDLRGNLFSADEIQVIKQKWKQSHSEMKIAI